MKEKEFARDLIRFIKQSPTAFHTVKLCKELLTTSGFRELKMNEKWEIKEKGKYFITTNSSSIIGFKINSEGIEKEGFRIVGSHSDTPCLKVKANPEMISEGVYLKLNTEIYGGPILNTWMDRPLSIAGRIYVKSDYIFKPQEILVNIDEPICIIPNLAIHMNRNINSGVEINKQKDMLPVLGVINDAFEKDNLLLNLIAKKLSVKAEDILSFDLSLYENEAGRVVGVNEEFISASRLDNLAMVHSSVKALIESNKDKGISVVAIFDNEEVGSSTKQGADSNMLLNTLERICLSLNKNREEFFTSIYNSFMISADMAHAVHPNAGEKHDPTNRPVINKGPVIKINADQRYTTDAYSSSVFEGICKLNQIPYQKFLNKSDERGGSTIGPISSTHLDIPCLDVGAPMLAMHSIRECCGVLDVYLTYKSFNKFYEA